MSFCEEDYWRECANLARRNADAALQGSYAASRPHVIYKPTLAREESVWVATLGDVRGVGSTPQDAMFAFDEAWTSSTGEHTRGARSDVRRAYDQISRIKALVQEDLYKNNSGGHDAAYDLAADIRDILEE